MTTSRFRRACAGVLAALGAGGCAQQAGRLRADSSPGARALAPVPDADAIREATAQFEPRLYVSALAYRHYIQALLLRQGDGQQQAVAELREALLFDPESAHLRTVLAETLVRLGRVAQAEEELKAALLLSSKHGPALVLAAQLAAAAQRDEQARGYLKTAIDADPDDVSALRELVRLEVSTGRVPAAHAAAEALAAAAQRALEAAASARRTEEQGVAGRDLRGADWAAHRAQVLAAEAFVDLARARASQRDDGAAADDLARAAALAPGEEQVLAAQAQFLESRRRLREAREVQLRLLARRPDAPDALAALGRLALQGGDVAASTAYAQKLRVLAGDLAGEDRGREEDRRELAQALFRLGIPLLGAQRGLESLALFDAALSLVPGNTALTFYRAVALARSGQAAQAAQLFEQLAALPARADAGGFLDVDRRALQVDAQVQAALARARAGQAEEACTRLRKLLLEHPTEEAIGVALLEAFERAGRPRDAVPPLEAAVTAYPRNQSLLYALATAYDRAGDKAAAFSAMRRVLGLDPQHAGALNYVGYALVEKGSQPELDEAERLLRRAVSLRPDDGAIADSLGYCLLREGRLAEALGELQRANGLTPDDPVVLGHLGDALLANGKREEAAQAFRRALKDLAPRVRARSQAIESARVEPVRAEIPRVELEPDGDQPHTSPSPDRLPEPGDAGVRAELEAKLRSLTAR